MPNTSVYLPDDLAHGLEARRDQLNVSAICQRALRKELAMLDTLEKTEFERIELIIETLGEETEKVAFTGRWLVKGVKEGAPPYDRNVVHHNVALTQKGRLVVSSENWAGSRYKVFDSLEELADAGYPGELVAETRTALPGDPSVVELDI